MIEYKTRVTSQEDLSKEVQNLADGLSQKADLQALTNAFTEVKRIVDSKAATTDLNKYVTNIIEVADKIQAQLCDMSVYGISSSGYVDIKKRDSCLLPGPTIINGGVFATPEYQSSQIRLTLRSDHDALKRQVDSLKAQLAQLQTATKITPVADVSQRTFTDSSGLEDIVIYPLYGDWILTSDTAELHLSFAGLKAEVGRSIYIQTRKRVYLLANRHSFFGLPGDPSKGTAVDQWLSNNTTYRFLRVGATEWFVTASSSPYPWT